MLKLFLIGAALISGLTLSNNVDTITFDELTHQEAFDWNVENNDVELLNEGETSSEETSSEESSEEVIRYDSIPVCEDFNLTGGYKNVFNNITLGVSRNEFFYVLDYLNFDESRYEEDNRNYLMYHFKVYQKKDNKYLLRYEKEDEVVVGNQSYKYNLEDLNNLKKLKFNSYVQVYGITNYTLTFFKEDIEIYIFNLTTEEVIGESYECYCSLGDSVAPVIEGPTTLIKATGLTLTTKDITKLFKATDDVDGVVDVKVKSDSYTGYGDKAGTYEIAFTATDKAGNKATKVLDIEVMNNIPNVFYTDLENIYVNKNVGLSEEEIMNVLIATEEVQPGYSSFGIESEDFIFDSANTNDEGSYKLTINARYTDGNEIDLEKTVTVYDSLDEVKEGSGNWFVNLLNGFYNVVIRNVLNFLISIWNGILEMFNNYEFQIDYLEKI